MKRQLGKIAAAFLALAFATGVVLTAPAGTAQECVTIGATEKSVLLLTPSLVFEKLKDESPLDPAKFGSAALGQELSVYGEQCFRSKGFGIIPAASVPPEAATLIGGLEPMAARLARGSLTPDLRTTLAAFASRAGPTLIFAQYFRVRVGEKGYFGPSMYGQVWSGQSETLLAAALIDPAGGAVVWKNQTLVRKILKPNSKDMEKALSMLYANL